jgi:predicted DNA-binding protein
MLSVTIESSLHSRLEHMAQSIGKTAEEIVHEAVSEHFEQLSRQKLYELTKSVEETHYVRNS